MSTKSVATLRGPEKGRNRDVVQPPPPRVPHDQCGSPAAWGVRPPVVAIIEHPHQVGAALYSQEAVLAVTSAQTASMFAAEGKLPRQTALQTAAAQQAAIAAQQAQAAEFKAAAARAERIVAIDTGRQDDKAVVQHRRPEQKFEFVTNKRKPRTALHRQARQRAFVAKPPPAKRRKPRRRAPGAPALQPPQPPQQPRQTPSSDRRPRKRHGGKKLEKYQGRPCYGHRVLKASNKTCGRGCARLVSGGVQAAMVCLYTVTAPRYRGSLPYGCRNWRQRQKFKPRATPKH